MSNLRLACVVFGVNGVQYDLRLTADQLLRADSTPGFAVHEVYRPNGRVILDWRRLAKRLIVRSKEQRRMNANFDKYHEESISDTEYRELCRQSSRHGGGLC